jgi:hypothetical protein
MANNVMVDRKRHFSRLGTRAAACLLVAGAFGFDGTAQAAGRVFQETWESGTTTRWGSDGSRTRCRATQSAVDSGRPHGGGYMVECNWNGTVAWDNADAMSVLALNQWDYSREFLIRMWVRYATDVDHVQGAKLFRLYPGAPAGSFYAGAQMEKTGGPLLAAWEMIAGSSGPVAWGDGAPFGDGNWH